MQNYTLTKTFSFKEEAKEFTTLLEKESIGFKVEKIDQNLIPFLTTTAQEGYGLFILDDDIEKLEAVIGQSVGEEDLSEHPLQVLSDDELIDVLKKQDEWSIEDILITRRLLEDRKVEISDEEIQSFHKERIIELRKTRAGSKISIILSFMLPIIGILGAGRIGILGTIVYIFSYAMGINYMLDSKKLPNGERVKTYDKNTRRIGLLIILWALLITGGTILFIPNIL